MHVFSLSHEGFGFNTNILETNILNLAVVIWLIVTNLGPEYASILEKRRENITSMIARVEEKYKEALAVRRVAQLQVIEAKSKAVIIQSEGRVFTKQIYLTVLKEAREEDLRLKRTEFEKRQQIQIQSNEYIRSTLVRLLFSKAPTVFQQEFQEPSIRKSATLNWIEKASLEIS